MTPNYESIQQFLEPENLINLIAEGVRLVNDQFDLTDYTLDAAKLKNGKITLKYPEPIVDYDLGELPEIDKWGSFHTKAGDRYFVLSELLINKDDNLICLPIGERVGARFWAICQGLGEKQEFNRVEKLLKFWERKRGIFTQIFNQAYHYPEFKLSRRLDSDNILEWITLSRRTVLADDSSYAELSFNQQITVGGETFEIDLTPRRSLGEQVDYRASAAQRGLIDPIDTPSGQSAGTIFTLPLHTIVDEKGRIKTKQTAIEYESEDDLEQVQSSTDLHYLLAQEGRNLHACPKCEAICLFEAETEDYDCLVCFDATCEPLEDFGETSHESIFGPSLLLVPFLNANDGVRAQMGANALRHAISPQTLINPQKPIVSTGRENEIAALFDGVSAEALCPGNNLIAAFLPWYGWNFEDGIVISQEVINQNLLSYREKKSVTIGTNKGEEQEIVLTEARSLAVGDKIANRHGNKGVITKIESTENMPYFYHDGKIVRIQIILNPFGVVSRRNIGQILETNLGLCSLIDGEPDSFIVDYPAGKSATTVKEILDKRYGDWRTQINSADILTAEHANLNLSRTKTERGKNGYVSLFLPPRDGRPAKIMQRVTVGYQYFLRLEDHDADDKLSARSTSTQAYGNLAYNRATGQPVAGRAQHGGQRFGEMETWALEGWSPEGLSLLEEILGSRSEVQEEFDRRRLFMPDNQKLNVAEAWKQLFYDLLTTGIVLDLLDENDNPLDWWRERTVLEKVSQVQLRLLPLNDENALRPWLAHDNLNTAKITNPKLPRKTWQEIFEQPEAFIGSLFDPDVFCATDVKRNEFRLRSRLNGIGYIKLHKSIPNPLAIRSWARKLRVSEWGLVNLLLGLLSSEELKKDDDRTQNLNQLIDEHNGNFKSIITSNDKTTDDEYDLGFIEVIPVQPPVYRWGRRREERLVQPTINHVLRNIIIANERVRKFEDLLEIANKLKDDLDALSDEEARQLPRLIAEFSNFEIKLEGFSFNEFKEKYEKFAVAKEREGRTEKEIEIVQLRSLELQHGEKSTDLMICRAKLQRTLYWWIEKLLLNQGNTKIHGEDHKPISARIFEKKGILRSAILGKRVDFSARAVITGNPDLEIDQCGLPALATIRMFEAQLAKILDAGAIARLCKLEPFELEQLKLKTDEPPAKEIIDDYDSACEFLETLFTDEKLLVLLNRQPTLTRDSIRAFRPMIHHGATIQISPLITKMFAGDFDGDQMSCYPILTRTNLTKAEKLLPTLDALSIADGSSLLNSSMDFHWGAKGDFEPQNWRQYLTTATESGISAGVLDLISDDEIIHPATLETNPLWQIVKSGAKGNDDNLDEIFGRDLNGNRTGKSETLCAGMSSEKHFENCTEALKNIMTQALGTSEPGTLCRKLVLAVRGFKITTEDCGSDENPRSPLTCRIADGLCQTCVGKNLATGADWELDAAIGVNSALSISERMTQLIISSAKHHTKHGTDFPIEKAKRYFNRPQTDLNRAIEGYELFNEEVARVHFEIMLKALGGKSPQKTVSDRDHILEQMASLIGSNHQRALSSIYEETSGGEILDRLLNATSALMILKLKKEGCSE